MTKLLERALSEISKLPEKEQDALASVLLQKMAAEKKWSKMFEQSQDILADMAQEAEEEYNAGNTRRFPFPLTTLSSHLPIWSPIIFGDSP